jgi:hypothetical protein
MVAQAYDRRVLLKERVDADDARRLSMRRDQQEGGSGRRDDESSCRV